MGNNYTMPDVLLIEPCNFEDFPVGGQLTAAKQILSALGERVALVGVTTDLNVEVGKWAKINIDGVDYDYFPAIRIKHSNKKPLIPMRIQWYLSLKFYSSEITSIGAEYAMTQSIDSLCFALKNRFRVCCHWSAGLNNPFKYTRYKYAKLCGFLFGKFWANKLKKVDILLAAADSRTIGKFKAKHKCLNDKEMISFPTRFDDNIFYACCDSIVKSQKNNKIIVSVGRISSVKGWDFILNSFLEFNRKCSGYKLVFVGDGEDRPHLESLIRKYSCCNTVSVTGYLSPYGVAEYLRNADLAVVGSNLEGWCTAIVEALACGCKVVTTNVSAAEDMIVPGDNGYIVYERDPVIFSDFMVKAVRLAGSNPHDLLDRLKLTALKEDLKRYCDFLV